jgi:hypothetical protein
MLKYLSDIINKDKNNISPRSLVVNESYKYEELKDSFNDPLIIPKDDMSDKLSNLCSTINKGHINTATNTNINNDQIPKIYPTINTTKTIPLITYGNANHKERIEICKKLCDEICKTKTCAERQNISKCYDSLIIADVIRKYNFVEGYIVDMISDKFDDQTGIIFYMVEKEIPIQAIEKLSQRININYVDNNNNTCLWKATNADYLIKLLSSDILNFDVSHKNNDGLTIFSRIMASPMNSREFSRCIKILVKRKFDFNILYNNFSFLDLVCSTNTNYEKVGCLIKIINYDITKTTTWLYMIIHNYNTRELSMLVCNNIMKRLNYVFFLNTIMNSYSRSYKSADGDMLTIMNFIEITDKKKLVEMLQYVNGKGNNLLHIASTYHLDNVIRFIMTDEEYGGVNLLTKNDDGFTPHDLYMKNDISSLLHKSVNLF